MRFQIQLSSKRVFQLLKAETNGHLNIMQFHLNSLRFGLLLYEISKLKSVTFCNLEI